MMVRSQVWGPLSSLLDLIAFFIDSSKVWFTTVKRHLWTYINVLIFLMFFSVWVRFGNYHSRRLFCISLEYLFLVWGVDKMMLPMMKPCPTKCFFMKQTSQVCLIFQRANPQRQWTFYTGGCSRGMEPKVKGIGREKTSQWWHLQLWNSELTRVGFVCPLKGFSCGSQQSSVVWYILNMHLWCGARMSCSLQTSVELARSQHGLCCNQDVVRKGSWIISQSKEEENIAGYGAMHLKKWIRRGLLPPANIFRSLFDPILFYNGQAEAGGKTACHSDHWKDWTFLSLVQPLLH